jgi:5-bromo-4-chloroindolyl phosphate hydrolysis protein
MNIYKTLGIIISLFFLSACALNNPKIDDNSLEGAEVRVSYLTKSIQIFNSGISAYRKIYTSKNDLKRVNNVDKKFLKYINLVIDYSESVNNWKKTNVKDPNLDKKYNEIIIIHDFLKKELEVKGE